MKTKFWLLLVISTIISSCNDMKDFESPSTLLDTGNYTGRMFVLCEGLSNHNNSTLACIDFNSKTLYLDFFKQIGNNKRGLGDTANDMKLFGKQLWIVVNISSQIEIIDIISGKSIKQIPLFSETEEGKTARQPRNICFYNNKAYVCCFDGTVVRINTENFEIEATVQCGRNPDGITVVNEKIYVSNSGGIDVASGSGTYDKTISVIDINTFQEIKKIEVGINPHRIIADSEGDVYVVSRGNRLTVKGKLHRINSQTDLVLEEFENLDASNFDMINDTLYMYSYNDAQDTYWIKTFDCKTEQIISEQFIPDSINLRVPFGIFVHPATRDIFISDANKYTELGDVYCFEQNGTFKFKIKNVGLNPNTFIFSEN